MLTDFRNSFKTNLAVNYNYVIVKGPTAPKACRYFVFIFFHDTSFQVVAVSVILIFIVATHLRHGAKFSLSLSPLVKEFRKSISIWQIQRRE